MLQRSWPKLVIMSQKEMTSDLRKLIQNNDLRKFGFASRIVSNAVERETIKLIQLEQEKISIDCKLNPKIRRPGLK